MSNQVPSGNFPSTAPSPVPWREIPRCLCWIGDWVQPRAPVATVLNEVLAVFSKNPAQFSNTCSFALASPATPKRLTRNSYSDSPPRWALAAPAAQFTSVKWVQRSEGGERHTEAARAEQVLSPRARFFSGSHSQAA